MDFKNYLSSKVRNVLKNKNVFITIRIVTAILLLYYHHKKSMESIMCRPLYITSASHFRWLSFLLKINTFCLCVYNSSTNICVFRISHGMIPKVLMIPIRFRFYPITPIPDTILDTIPIPGYYYI